MNQTPQTRRLNIADTLRLLRFLKDTVFTPETIAKAQEMGKSLGDLLADIFTFAKDLGQQYPTGSRDLTDAAEIDAAGLTDVFEVLQYAAKKH